MRNRRGNNSQVRATLHGQVWENWETMTWAHDKDVAMKHLSAEAMWLMSKLAEQVPSFVIV